uniref:phospholipase D n=1 Tax=Phytophthora ramorum TaxID=164328 RepID=H3GSH2_PHYRM
MFSYRRRAMLLFASAGVLAVAPTPSAALSFSNLFNDDNDDPGSQESSTVPVSQSESGSDDDDLSDGSDITPQQPILDAEKWFLTEQEITRSRGGVPRTDLSVYTTGNAVTSYTATNEFYNAVYDDLSTTKEGDRVMLATWLSALVPLKPDVDPTGAKTGFKEVFAGVVERGGNVDILGWASIAGGYMPYNYKARNAINSIPPSPINGARALYIFDDRINLIASHHQKTLVIAANTSAGRHYQPVAYVGGIDLAIDRWDTMYHNNTAIRDAGNITYINKGWVDGHLRIHGPAAKDVANNFVARWNSDYLPCRGLDDELLNFENPSYEDIPSLDYGSSNTTASLGNQSIQITRTFSCTYKHYKEFAPKGENSLFHARIKAIKNAKNFIYIEDQYFVYVPELLDALMEVMPRIQRLIVVTKEQTNAFTNGGYIKYLYQNVHPLRSKYPNKFKIYTTKADRKLLIHTKLVIIDDVYLSIGSANWNRRSMTADPELNADVVDGDTVMSPEGLTVGKLPRDFRIRKFQEMTGLSYEKLDDMTFVEAADQFKLAAMDESTILANLEIEYHAYFVAIIDTIRKASDPEFTCY